jgi:hypothetical protein
MTLTETRVGMSIVSRSKMINFSLLRDTFPPTSYQTRSSIPLTLPLPTTSKIRNRRRMTKTSTTTDGIIDIRMTIYRIVFRYSIRYLKMFVSVSSRVGDDRIRVGSENVVVGGGRREDGHGR